MNRIYKYRGFEVTVEVEPVWAPSKGTALSPAKGFLAIVNIVMAGMTRPMVVPMRLTADGQHPFPSEAEALMAGYSAGQRVIDDILVE
ncbi:hypothetical protein M3I54_33905 [Paraburkholderia sp. CNPSo 3274]|uniref:hypothetical protein n=1 Tax=Paraburkholderia sp. CNPSo 3274 TaxID=2940932 RepID=UPI0020B7F806|nr:hypothetical protein [Paraburkholderia sp. CNPSo 3274]MCP3711891.1 hypothetical protein [Paraburkholderia sp. CNPSo 3274]